MSVTITDTEYDQLIEDQRFLQVLMEYGVDNWEGYEAAQDAIDE